MTATPLPCGSWLESHRQFETHLPTITRIVRSAFRRRRRQDREEAVAEGQENAWQAWHGLLQRGRDPVAAGVAGIASFAIRHVLKGRRLGNPHRGGRGAMSLDHRGPCGVWSAPRLPRHARGVGPGRCACCLA